MTPSRREFLASAAVAATTLTPSSAAAVTVRDDAPPAAAAPSRADSFEPWLEVDDDALRHNAREIARLAGGRPVLAVVKNNGYGLGTARAGSALDAAPEIAGFAVVKPAEARELRTAGVRKPVLFMGYCDVATAVELVREDVRLAPYTDDAASWLGEVARGAQRAVTVHAYIDTGMSRLGIPYHRALEWLAGLAARPDVRIEGTFMTFTESDAFDAEQLARFLRFVADARARGIEPGRLHAASSHALFLRPDTHLDGVRTGLALYGAYPAGTRERALAELRPAFRLRARVVRVDRLRAGDGVSYGHNYVAERPTWIATLPAGHADGYPRTAVRGAEVLIDGRLYPVIGAVSASHTIIEVGETPDVAVGDSATLIGPDHDAVHPNTLAERAGISVYDVLMRLSPLLAR
jgi:alanine racemase